MSNIDKKLLKKKEKVFMGDDYKLLVPLAEEFKQYDMTESVKILKYCIKKHPGDMSAHVSLGKIYMENGYAESAIVEFERVVGAIPSNILSHRKLAALYAKTGQKEKAIMANNMILALNTGDREALEAINSLTENPTESMDEITKTEKIDNIEDIIAASLADDEYTDTLATEPDTLSEDIITSSDENTEEVGDEMEKIEDIEDLIAASLADDEYTDTLATEPDTFLDDITAEVLNEAGTETGKTENIFYIDDTIVVNAGDLADDGGFIVSPNEPVTVDDEDDTETIITKAGVELQELQNEVANVSWDPFAEPPAPLSSTVNEYDLNSSQHSDDEIIELTSVDYISVDDSELDKDGSELDSENHDLSEKSLDMDVISDSEMKALVLGTSDTDEELVGTAGFDSDVNELMASISVADEMEVISDTDDEEVSKEVTAEVLSPYPDDIEDEEQFIKEEIEMIENYILTERFLPAIRAYTLLHERFPDNLVIKTNLDNLRQSARLMDRDENALIRKLDFLKNRLKEKVQDVYAGPAYN